MKSSTNRALVAKKQSTFSAFVANSIQKVLQGYTKGIRFLLVMFLTLTVSANVWGADYTLVTSNTNLNNGDKVIIATKNSSGKPNTGVTGQNGNNDATVSTTESNWVQYIVGSASASGWTLYDSGQNKYIAKPTGNHFKYSTTAGTCFVNNNGVLGCNSRYLQANDTYYRMYSGINNNYTPFYVWKVSASYTITAQSNNTNYGTVLLNGTTITAYPETGYRVSTTTPCTISPSGSATVTPNGNTFTVTPSDNTIIIINFEAIPKYTVTLKDDDSTLTQSSAGGSVTLPPRDGCADYEFVGWTKSWTEEQDEWTTSAPEIISVGDYTPTANENLYPVYTKTETTEGTPTTTNTTYTHTILSKTWSANGAQTLNSISWTLDNNGSYYGYDGTKGQQVGSSGSPAKSMTLTTSGFASATKITAVRISTSGASSVNAKVSVTVGSTSYTYNDNTEQSISTTNTEYEFEGNSTGNVTISWTQTSSKALYFKKIEVDYQTTTGGSSSTTYYISVPSCCTALGGVTNLSISNANNNVIATWDATSSGGESNYLVKLYNSDKTSVISSQTVGSSTKTYAFNNPGAGVYLVSVTPLGSGNYCAEGTETFSTNSVTISGNVTVTFNANGGSLTITTQTIVYDTATNLTSFANLGGTAPTCKKFKHWNIAANGSGTTYTDGQSVTLTGALNLYAIYEDITYSVTDGTMTGVASHSYSSNPIICGTNLTITCAAANTHKGEPTVTATGTHGDITVVSATEVTIANVQSDITVSISYTPKETYTITWNAAGNESTTTVVEGNSLGNLPDKPTSCSDTYTTFVGWYTAASGMETSPSTEPQGTQVTVSTVPTDDATYYAVWADAGDAEDVVDVINNAFTINKTQTNYATWSNTGTSGTSYTGNSAGSNGTVQLRSSDASGIVTTTSGGKATKVVVSWNSGTTGGRTLDIYGKSSAYSAATDLYSTSTQGTKLGSIVYGTSTELTISGDYEYIGLRSNSGAMYLDKIQITWSAGSEPTGYISSCCQSPAVVTVTPANDNLELNIDGTASTTVHISQTGGGNGTYYEPTVSPTDGASLDWAALDVDYKKTAYDINFTATKAGTYTVTGNFKETGYDCQKTGSATITVAANPILQVSEPTITSECGTEGTPVAVTIDSRYLKGSSLTASVETTSDTEHGTFKICATADGDFATTDLTGLTAGQDSKATVTIYVRYDAAVDNIDDATGTLTIKDGTTSQTVDLTTTPTCGTSIRMTPTDANSVRVTTANGQWTRTQTAIHLRGSYLLQNLTGDQGAKVELTSSNSNFKFVKPDVASSGTVKYESEKITDNTWEADVYLVYTPTAYDANETTTITAKVITFGGTTEHASATLTAYGRSFPETFVLALYTGSKWVALPADMIAPYGGCTTGVGTHDPYPITVNDNADPTTATLAPTRAIYKGAARNEPKTNPWTIQFESNTQAGYYLFGSNNTNTTIANTKQATGEGVKWALATEDNVTYQLSQTTTTNGQKLGYNGTNKTMGQYQSSASNFKYDFRILPVTSTCTYYIEPVMTLVDYTDDEAKVRIQYDGTNLYQISTDNKANWTNVEGEIDCLDLTFTLPNSTYRGTDVWLKPQGTLCEPVESSASCHIPAPVINNPGDQNFVGTVNQQFSGTFTITGSDLYKDISAITITNNSNTAIGANINNGTITVTMAAAAVGTYTTYLTFDAVGAEEVTVKVTIEIRALATQSFDGGSYAFTDATPKILCENLTSTYEPIIYLSHSLYKNGTAISTTSELNETNFTLIDLNTGESLSFSREGSDGGIAKITLNETSRSSMIPGHTYRLSWENTDQVMTDENDLPYMDCHMDFVYSENCDAPTALAACPITNRGFTANWVPVADCTGNVTVDVYTRGAGTTLIDKTTFSTTEVKDLQYAGESNLSGSDWITNIEGTKGGAPSISSNRLLISDVSDNEYYNLFSPILSNIGTINESTIYTITVTLYQSSTDASAGAYFYVMDNGSGLAKNTTPTITDKSVTIDGQTATYKKLTAGTTTFTVKGLSSDDRIRFLGFETISIASSSKKVYISSIKIEASGSITSVATQTPSCSAGSAEFTELTANTQYYYTVSDGTNTSNEIAVTTYTNDPSLKFYSDEACTAEIDYTTVLGGEETTVYVEGTKVPGCDIATSVSSGYGMDDSGLNYNVTTGAVTGSIILTLTDANTTEGTLTITDAKGNDYVLNIVSSDCPAGFGTMALSATNITNESAQANWTSALDFGDDKSGTLHLYKNGIVNRELIVNGDFETGTLTAGWSNGLNEGDMDAVYSFKEYAIANSNVHEGSYCLSVTGEGSRLLAFQNMSVMYADYVTLTPGTYTMSAWVKMPVVDNKYTDKKQSFALGLIGGDKSEVKVVCVSDTTIVQSNNTYVQLTYEFTLTSTVRACPAIGAYDDDFRDFYLDDVSLMCTSIGQSDEPYLSIDIADLSATGNLALTGLSGNTEYTYVIQNADGCSSNSITFITEGAGAPTLSVVTPVSIAAPLGGSNKGVSAVTATDAYSTINVTLADNEQRIRLNATTIPAAGGVVQFTFTPLNTDYPGTTGTSIVTLTTQGMANPVELIINWAVTSGIDVNTPMVEVTDISNENITIEHNVGVGDDDLEVRIVMNRPITDDEKEDNVGDEIFFSKYYEAYMHKKLWAIFNPTAQKRSLAGMQVWRSQSNYEDWNTENVIDLSTMGNHEAGWIYPNEEIIVYTADQVGECEQGKADMSNWTAMSSENQPLSFSGNDALLLVRKVSEVNDDRNNTPPTKSIDGTSISWRTYTDSESVGWYMLDLIGARKDNNTPDGSATQSWTWTDCTTNTTESGDADGWVGYGYDLADNNLKYKDCEGAGYLLSTNRCLLIRRMDVKSGAAAVNTNIGDMITLNNEWKGSHVPKGEDQEETSCENFSFVGGYDYDGYYNAWVPLDGDEFVYASQNEDGTYTFDMDVPHYYCDTMRIEVVETVTVNGVESDNIHAYNHYKVPIVVDVNADTDDQKFFQYPERPSNELETEIEGEKILTAEICETCDVVIRDGAQLTHVENGQGQFRNMMVYPGAKFSNTDGQAFELQGLHIQALNDTVGYAIITKDQSSITVDSIIHTKRINDKYWYNFSLPYDCNVAAIRQLNGKTMGVYGTDWGIQYYNGRARQEAGTSAAPGQVSNFWGKVEPNDTLEANKAYSIGLFTTEWKNQHKTIFFPPTETTKYTESGDESKETKVYNWNVNLTAELRHHGWNFVGSPYISLFDPSGQTDAGVNNGSVVIKGEIQADGTYTNDTEVFVSIPDGSDTRTYTQQRAASTKLEPFKGYFIQVVDPSGEDERKTLQYSKTGRTLSNSIPARKAQAAREKVVVELEVHAEDKQVDYAGVLVDDDYTAQYEISGDLIKMYAAGTKPQLYLRDSNNEMMAYIALPDANAENIPLELYAPKAGNYTLSMNQQTSRTKGAKTIELLYNGEVVANLLFDTYTIVAKKGVNTGYSIRIRRVAQVITSLDNVNMDGVRIATSEGYISIEGLPSGAQVLLYDMVGKLIQAGYEMDGIVNFDAPVQGVYEIAIQSAQGQACVKTIIR